MKNETRVAFELEKMWSARVHERTTELILVKSLCYELYKLHRNTCARTSDFDRQFILVMDDILGFSQGKSNVAH